MFARALDILFPPQCLSCGNLTEANGTLCLACWQHIQFIDAPYCQCCGHPFEFSLGNEALCGDCMREMPPYAQARAVFRYNEHSRSLVLKLKYADQTQLAKTYGNWLAKAGKELIIQSDVIVPVPLHYWRFVSRRYNQAALLAQSVARLSGLEAIPDGLTRIRHTITQTGLTRKQREENVRGAFVINSRKRAALKGKTVLLIDDVMTTSATLTQCAKALLDAGALRVNVLTLARTVD